MIPLKKTFPWFRKIAFAEGVSFLLLLLVAMPLKYIAHIPIAVSIAGGIHGLLFISYFILARQVKSDYEKNNAWLGKAMLVSVLPAGTFFMEKKWKEEEKAYVKNN